MPTLTDLMPLGLTALPARTFAPSLLLNGGFESGLTAWTVLPANQFALDPAVAHSGTQSLRLTYNAPTFVPSATQKCTLAAGTWRLTVWITGTGLVSPAPLPGVTYGVRVTVLRGSTVVAASPVITGASVPWTQVIIPALEVTAPAEHRVSLEAYHMPAGGIAWFDDVALERMVDLPVDVFLRYPNWRGLLFDDQPLTIRAGVTVPAGATGTLAAQLVDSAGGVVSTVTAPAMNGEITLDASAMVPWTVHTVTVTAGAYTAPAYRVARVPGSQKALMNVACDEHNCIVLHGTPRFLLGAYDSGLDTSSAASFWESKLWSLTDNAGRHLDGTHFNAYLNYFFGATPASIMRVMMDSLFARGVVYFQTANVFNGSYPTGTTSPPAFITDLSDQDVKDNAAHPGFAGYYVADEAFPETVPATFTRRQRLLTLNPAGATLAINLNHLSLWRDVCDLPGIDSYPMFGPAPTGGYTHEKVATDTRASVAAVQNARPTIAVLQFFSFSGSPWPTLAQMRTHAYMAIIEGARGLFWWSLGTNALAWASNNGAGPSNVWDANRLEYMNRFKTLVNELAQVEPALIAEAAPLIQSVSSPAIHWLAKTTGQVFTCNYLNATVTAIFTRPDGRTLTETYAPYEAKLLTLEATVPKTVLVNGTFTNVGSNATTAYVGLKDSAGTVLVEASTTVMVPADPQPVPVGTPPTVTVS